ncbi:AraC family transcriptional regulator [Halosquirtibacter xylanolyticus]|nr:AraC family transcriptional regulator [Prolixibacteraceae bacterium]
MNEKKLKIGFKELFGNTIYGYLFDYRMNHAKVLLEQTSLSVHEIGIQCGYSYPSHFTTAFRRKCQCTPKSYRERVLKVGVKNR